MHAIFALLACTLPTNPVDATLASGDPGLSRWLQAQEGSRVTLRGRRFRRGGVHGVLGAALVSDPGRWERDRWPLGTIVFDGGITDASSAGPDRVTGTVWLDRASRTVEARLQIEGTARHGMLAFSLWGAPSLFGASVPWATDHTTWLLVPRTRHGEVTVDVHYRLRVRDSGFDVLERDVLVLTAMSWLPTPARNELDATIDVRLVGAGDLELRSGGSLTREGDDWRLTGSARAHKLLVGRPTWATVTGAAEGVEIDVAIAPASPTDPQVVLARASEAIEALGSLGTLPTRLWISEVPDGRAPAASLAHIVLPEGELDGDPLSLAHEVVHVLQGLHAHVTPGLPALDEPTAEYLSLRAARWRSEATRQRRLWQHTMDAREGTDGRPLLDAYRQPTAQYPRGALVLQALEDRIGEAALLELLLPLSERSHVTWAAFAEQVEARDAETGRWLRAVLDARNLPEPIAERSGDWFTVVDAGDTGVPLELDVRVLDDALHVLDEHRVVLGDVGPLLMPPGGAVVEIDPNAVAPIRRARRR